MYECTWIVRASIIRHEYVCARCSAVDKGGRAAPLSRPRRKTFSQQTFPRSDLMKTSISIPIWPHVKWVGGRSPNAKKRALWSVVILLPPAIWSGAEGWLEPPPPNRHLLIEAWVCNCIFSFKNYNIFYTYIKYNECHSRNNKLLSSNKRYIVNDFIEHVIVKILFFIFFVLNCPLIQCKYQSDLLYFVYLKAWKLLKTFHD